MGAPKVVDGKLVVENYRDQHVPEDEFEIIDADPGSVWWCRRIVDESGRGWHTGWYHEKPGGFVGVAWEAETNRYVGNVEDSATTPTSSIFNEALLVDLQEGNRRA
jgi:hypothetical protein